MSISSIENLEESIKKLKASISDTGKFKDKLKLKEVDLTRYIKMAEQNIKYLKKKTSIPVAKEFQKVLKACSTAKKELALVESDIKKIEKSIEKLEKNLESQIEILENLKKVSDTKILPFRRKST